MTFIPSNSEGVARSKAWRARRRLVALVRSVTGDRLGASFVGSVWEENSQLVERALLCDILDAADDHGGDVREALLRRALHVVELRLEERARPPCGLPPRIVRGSLTTIRSRLLAVLNPADTREEITT